MTEPCKLLIYENDGTISSTYRRPSYTFFEPPMKDVDVVIKLEGTVKGIEVLSPLLEIL
jgi:hypothetical protein